MTFIFLLSAAIASGSITCKLDIATATADLTAAGKNLEKAAKDCPHNTTAPDCIAAIKAAETSLNGASAEMEKAATDCTEAGSQCQADLEKVAGAINDAVQGLEKAGVDCTSGNHSACLTDLTHVSSDLVTAAVNMIDAEKDCGNKTLAASSSVKCKLDIATATADLASAAKELKPAATACEQNSTSPQCLNDLKVLEGSVNNAAKAMTSAAADCTEAGSECQRDVEAVAAALDDGLQGLEKAGVDCSTGNKSGCVADLTKVASDLSKATLSIIDAEKDCGNSTRSVWN